MTLFDVLAFYGAAGDAACGNPPGFGARKAATAISLSTIVETHEERDALYFAGLLHAAGAIDSPAYRNDGLRTERSARIAAWDVPARGARICSELGMLPPATADIVRWQAECWDGTGYPDQLRWHAIPRASAVLALADAYVRAGDPEEALTTISSQSGRAFGPELVRAFTNWLHLTGGEVEPLDPPALAVPPETQRELAATLLDRIADAVDAHDGVAGRWRRIAGLVDGAASALALPPESRRLASLATRLYGCGQLVTGGSEEATFDPLARLGIVERARLGVAAAQFVRSNATLGEAAPVLQARAEWFDGSGAPHRLSGDAIPQAAGILAAAIAYDALDRKARIETAAGTQFDPSTVRAIVAASRAMVG